MKKKLTYLQIGSIPLEGKYIMKIILVERI